MRRLPVVPLLTMLFLLPLPSLAQQESAPPSPDPVAEELSSSLRRVANALERVLESQRADVELKRIEVASRILQLHWEQIAQLRSAAEAAEEEAASAEQNQQLLLAELDILSDRERELRDAPESEDDSGERRGRTRQLREERQKLESYIEQDKDRAWRMRDQASVYQSEMAEIRSRVAHLEAVIARWLDDLK
jgi:chromosome segregation ATPase